MRHDKTYLEMMQFKTFEERFNYLKLKGTVAHSTFGSDRYLNQALYTSPEWRRIRHKVIVRDNACDLGIEGREIYDKIIIHHINPITAEDILNRSPILFDLNNLVCVSNNTHEAIHYSDESILLKEWTPRTENDTCPWK